MQRSVLLRKGWSNGVLGQEHVPSDHSFRLAKKSDALIFPLGSGQIIFGMSGIL
jgi:hypothetical protein